ncbi:MAG: hypothetical protein ACK5PS_04190 [Desulfopila sp.]
MFIRALARDLYRVQQHIDALEKNLAATLAAERDDLRGELTRARQELAMLRRVLEGEKEAARFRMKFKGSDR